MSNISRRGILGASLAIAATPILPKAAWAAPGLPIKIAPNAADNKFTPMAASWCVDRIREGKLFVRQEFLDKFCKLTDPMFEIASGKPVWNYMTGYTDEIGVSITITELGVPIGEPIGIGTTIGYEEYWDRTKPADVPDYYVRNPHLKWEEEQLITPHLPKDHLEHDMRWLESGRASFRG